MWAMYSQFQNVEQGAFIVASPEGKPWIKSMNTDPLKHPLDGEGGKEKFKTPGKRMGARNNKPHG